MSGISSVTAIKKPFTLKLAEYLTLLKILALVLLVSALARPQWGVKHTNIQTEGINIVIAMDTSGSMAALDFKQSGKIVDRLTAVKGVIQDFLFKREGDRIGLVIFGTHAFTQVPLTRDYNTISYILNRIEIGAAGEKTAVGDAIGISLKRIEDIESASNVIILLTDGQSNSGEISPEMASDIARDRRIKIYTIGVGTRGEAPFLVKDAFGRDRYVKQKVDIDEKTLHEIADKTDGLYFRAENTKGLEDIYETINRLEKTEVEVKTFTDYREYYMYLLFPALILIGFYVLLSNTRFLRVP